MAASNAGSCDQRPPRTIIPSNNTCSAKLFLNDRLNSGGTLSCNEGSVVELVESLERRDLFAGDSEGEDSTDPNLEGRPEGIGKYFSF